jgi:hypothetical protein
VIELKEMGSTIAVTEYILNKQLDLQSRMFRKGLTRVISRSWLEMFNHD